MSAGKKAWGGRFAEGTEGFVETFTSSLPVDWRMWSEDLAGSIAHVRMLARVGVLSDEEASTIVSGLEQIGGDIEAGHFRFTDADEDIHMAVERALTDAIGPVGGKLHTARSRNDQVALDTRMYAKRRAAELAATATALRRTLLDVADAHEGVVLPGYTHLQRAQPVLLAHHLLAHFWMLTRDVARLRHAYDAADAMPLGSAALAGTSYPVDPGSVAEELGFSRLTENSMDAVADRDFLLDLVYACAACAVHLSRLAEELVLWSSDEFGFVTMDDAWATGSSIMPQKKNPDVAELVRGKSARVVGDLATLLTLLKGLPLAYDRDLQEDKEAAFDAADTVADCLAAMDGMLASMTVEEDAMRAAAGGGFMAATDLADHLAAKGVPFREAHEVVGALVLDCESRGATLADLTAEDLAAASEHFGEDALSLTGAGTVVARRTSPGGTAPERVAEQRAEAAAALDADDAWLGSVTGP